MQYHKILCNTMQCNAIPCNTMQFHIEPCNTTQYHAIQCNTMQYHAIPCNTMQYHAILCNTMQYYARMARMGPDRKEASKQTLLRSPTFPPRLGRTQGQSYLWLVEILKMKFDQDLCLNLWYDTLEYFGKPNLAPMGVVPLAMFFD